MLFMIKKIGTFSFFKMSKKLCYPSADKNKDPILEILRKHIRKDTEGEVLEIASGTGQHIAYFASHFPKLIFQPSEFETSLLDSIKEYVSEIPTKNVKEPIRIDVTENWKNWNVSNNFDYVININMIHITPFSCTLGLFSNVGGVLKDNGLLIIYGPFANNGVLEPQSNRDFDKNIRARDPNCGVRDIQDLIRVAGPCHLRLIKIYDMPSNNKCLIWKKNEFFE